MGFKRLGLNFGGLNAVEMEVWPRFAKGYIMHLDYCFTEIYTAPSSTREMVETHLALALYLKKLKKVKVCRLLTVTYEQRNLRKLQ